MQIKSRVTATNSLGEAEGFSARTPRVLPDVYSIFVMDPNVQLGSILVDIGAAEARLVSFSYSGDTSGVYLNRGLKVSEVLSDFSEKVEDEDAEERPIISFALWDEVSTLSLGETGEQASFRAEVPTLRFGEPGSETSTEPANAFLESTVRWADLGVWSPDDRDEGDVDRALQGRFRWEASSGEVNSFFEENEGPMAMEFDVKQINRGNSDPLPEVLETNPGVCLPWEKNDFWIGTREPSDIDTNLPDSAGFYWDTGLSDSCQEKDLSFGLYHPENLVSGELYEATVFFDGGAEEWEWLAPIFPVLDNETAVGDADASPFIWSVAMMGQHCDWSPWCVGIPKVDVDPVGLPLIKENDEFGEIDGTFEDYGPAQLPGCFRFNSPVYPGKGIKTGTLSCQMTLNQSVLCLVLPGVSAAPPKH